MNLHESRASLVTVYFFLRSLRPCPVIASNIYIMLTPAVELLENSVSRYSRYGNNITHGNNWRRARTVRYWNGVDRLGKLKKLYIVYSHKADISVKLRVFFFFLFNTNLIIVWNAPVQAWQTMFNSLQYLLMYFFFCKFFHEGFNLRY